MLIFVWSSLNSIGTSRMSLIKIEKLFVSLLYYRFPLSVFPAQASATIARRHSVHVPWMSRPRAAQQGFNALTLIVVGPCWNLRVFRRWWEGRGQVREGRGKCTEMGKGYMVKWDRNMWREMRQWENRKQNDITFSLLCLLTLQRALLKSIWRFLGLKGTI